MFANHSSHCFPFLLLHFQVALRVHSMLPLFLQDLLFGDAPELKGTSSLLNSQCLLPLPYTLQLNGKLAGQ